MNHVLRKSIRRILMVGGATVFAASVIGTASAALGVQNPPPGPGQVPDYFGITPNYATSPQPIMARVTGGTQGSAASPFVGVGAAATTYDYVNFTSTSQVMDVQGGTDYQVGNTLTVEGGVDANGTPVSCTVTVTNVSAENGAILPIVDANGVVTAPGVSGLASCAGFSNPIAGTGIRKFVNSMPSLNQQNDLGQMLPVAVPTLLPDGSEYYEIAEVEYTQKMHSDLPATHLRSYVQLDPSGNPTTQPQYLGPIIVATKDRPVRIKLVNKLSKSSDPLPSLAGNLPFPVDHTYMGAQKALDTDNRTAVHLHGGNTPWISDGQPRQWIKPQGEGTVADNRGASAVNVPDMWFSDGTAVDANGPIAAGTLIPECTGQTTCPGASNDPGAGALTYYYTNQQSARLMFYHDHAEGITRLNVYAGLAAGYVLRDPTELDLINGTNHSGNNPGSLVVLPTDEIPLVIQDKTFVPDDTTPVLNFYGPFKSQLESQDPTWRWGAYRTGTTEGQYAAPAGMALNGPGDLWVPHVYMTNQNPGDVGGANPLGRWDYGMWFWPPFVGANAITQGEILNPYYDPACNATTGVNLNPLLGVCEGKFIPGFPNGNKLSPAQIDALGNNWNGTPAAASLANDIAAMKAALPGQKQPAGQPEAFNDIMTVNGTVYPFYDVQPKKYRLRILSVGNDRHLNLSLVVASDKKGPSTVASNYNTGFSTPSALTAATCDGVNQMVDKAPDCTEVRQIPWDATTNGGLTKTRTGTGLFPRWWYTFQNGGVNMDGRPSGVFHPSVRGPAMVQIGTEGGFLSNPAVIRNQPINYEFNGKNIVVLNVKEHALLLGPAERADVVVDFSQFAGSTLIMYNDAPAALPAGDLRLDYYTGNSDNTDTGGTFSTQPGYGPNSRTIMQFRVAASCTDANCKGGALQSAVNRRVVSTNHPVDDFDPADITYDANNNLVTGGLLTTAVRTAFAKSQEPIIVPQAAHNVAYNTNVADTAGGNLGRISDNNLTFQPLTLDASGVPTGALDPAITVRFQPKSIIESFTMDFGRMNALLGVEVPLTSAVTQTSIPQAYLDPPTELVTFSKLGTPVTGQQLLTMKDGTQIWKITHNGVDTHPIHFHLFHVQLVNRVGWDGAITNPQANELGWKDTVRMNPLEDVVVALRPQTMSLPFKVKNHHRLLDPAEPANLDLNPMAFNLNPIGGGASNVKNKSANFGWEYVWHCHILGHEENDFMRSIATAAIPQAPFATSAMPGVNAGEVKFEWTDTSMVSNWVEIQQARDAAFTDIVSTTYKLTSDRIVNAADLDGSGKECGKQSGCAMAFTASVLNDVNNNPVDSYFRVRARNTVGTGNGVQDDGYDPLTGVYNNLLSTTLGNNSLEMQSLLPNTGTNGFTGYGNVTSASDWSNTVVNTSKPLILVSPTAVTFPNTAINATPVQTLTVKNIGGAPLTLSDISVTGGDASYSFSALVPPAVLAADECLIATPVPAGQSCSISVQFAPTAGVANATGNVAITSNSMNVDPTVNNVALKGAALLPAANLSPVVVDFGIATGIGETAIKTVTLTNPGSAKLDVSAIGIVGITPPSTSVPAVDQYTITGGTCAVGAPVAPKSSCTVEVSFIPQVSDLTQATLQVTDNANGVAGTVQSVTLTGASSVPMAALNPTSLDFSNTTDLNGNTLKMVVLSNPGTGVLNIALNGIAVSGTSFTRDTSITGSCGLTLAPKTSCNIGVRFSPTTYGTFTGTLTVTDDANGVGGSQQTVALTGTTALPLASVAPAALVFPATQVGATSPAQTLTISNIGLGSMTVNGPNSMAISGPFSLARAANGDPLGTCPFNDNSFVLTAGSNCTVLVIYRPTAAAPAGHFGTLTVTDNSGAVAGSTQVINLKGKTPAPDVRMTPSAGLTFVNTNVTSNSKATVTLTNTGQGTLNISGVAFTAPFSRVAGGCGATLAQGATCNITVQFTPVANGQVNGSMTLTSNAGGTPGTIQTLPLVGTGVFVANNDGPLSFGVGTSTTSQTVNVNVRSNDVPANTGTPVIVAGSVGMTNGAAATSVVPSISNNQVRLVINGTQAQRKGTYTVQYYLQQTVSGAPRQSTTATVTVTIQ